MTSSPRALPTPLAPEDLRVVIDPATLPFDLTSQAEPHNAPVGQERAVEAVHFAIGMRAEGYNLFCMGPEGTGKASLVRRSLQEVSCDRPHPDDWCYVHNFQEPHKPRALRLPAGRGRGYARDLDKLVEELRHDLPAAFEGDDYRSRRKAVEQDIKQRHDDAMENLRDMARERGIGMMRTPMGLALAPMDPRPDHAGEVMGPEDFKELPLDEQERLKDVMGTLQKDLEDRLQSMPRLDREKRERVRALDREVANDVVGHALSELKTAYDDCPAVLDHLAAIHDDILENISLFLVDGDSLPNVSRSSDEEGDGEGEQEAVDSDSFFLPPSVRRQVEEARFHRYRANALISNDSECGAPIVEEDHPIQPNLVGRIEHRQQFGALVTDFTLIKPGALHRANGGYLVVEARKLLMQPFAWEDLKRALRSREIRIEAPGGSWGVWSTQSLTPEPVPLDVKVVLLGEPMLYYELSDLDPDFRELFKVVADFNVRMDRSSSRERDLALLLAQMAREKCRLPLDRFAVAQVMEQAVRLAGNSRKFSAHMGDLADLMREAEFYAEHSGSRLITADHITAAIEGRRRRADRIPAAIREEMEHEVVHVLTRGRAIGQINGLSVMSIGPMSFGRPSRITARVRLGKGDVINIDRESELSGPLHDKGVMILTSFLGVRYAQKMPLALSATLVFEQSYGPVDGDSASSTELYALLSAIAEVPLRQDLAVTGSVDQFGAVQAIGGVNEKIEGFFDLCKARGLTGTQGVLIPAANRDHLMLRPDVVEAVRQGLFSVIPVSTIDQGLSLLTGEEAGEQREDGTFPEGSLNRRVVARLASFSRTALSFGESHPEPRGPQKS